MPPPKMQLTPKLARESKIQVFLADSDREARRQIELLSERFPTLELLGSSGTAEAVVDTVRTRPVDLLMMDLDLDGEKTGLELIPVLRQLKPEMKLLALAKQDGRRQKSSLLSGAHGFLLKPFHFGEVSAAVATLFDGRLYYDSGLLEYIAGTCESTGTDVFLPEGLTDEDR